MSSDVYSPLYKILDIFWYVVTTYGHHMHYFDLMRSRQNLQGTRNEYIFINLRAVIVLISHDESHPLGVAVLAIRVAAVGVNGYGCGLRAQVRLYGYSRVCAILTVNMLTILCELCWASSPLLLQPFLQLSRCVLLSAALRTPPCSCLKIRRT